LTTKSEQRLTGFEWNEGLVSRCRYETGINLYKLYYLLIQPIKTIIVIAINENIMTSNFFNLK